MELAAWKEPIAAAAFPMCCFAEVWAATVADLGALLRGPTVGMVGRTVDSGLVAFDGGGT